MLSFTILFILIMALHTKFPWNIGLISSMQKNSLEYSIYTPYWELARIDGCEIKTLDWSWDGV